MPNGLLFERMWKGTINSMASYNNIMATPKDNINRNNQIDNTKQSRKSTKVVKQFFEHDTRNNSEYYSYATGVNSANRRYSSNMYGNSDTRAQQNYDANRNGSSVPKTTTSISGDCSEIIKKDIGYQSFVSDNNNYRGKFIKNYNKPSTNQLVNNKLRKKLFKAQRKLRMQTVALRQQQYAASVASTYCCNCACSSNDGNNEKGSTSASVFQLQHHHTTTKQLNKYHNSYDCNNTAASSFLCLNSNSCSSNIANKLQLPNEIRGLRSVVR